MKKSEETFLSCQRQVSVSTTVCNCNGETMALACPVVSSLICFTNEHFWLDAYFHFAFHGIVKETGDLSYATCGLRLWYCSRKHCPICDLSTVYVSCNLVSAACSRIPYANVWRRIKMLLFFKQLPIPSEVFSQSNRLLSARKD